MLIPFTIIYILSVVPKLVSFTKLLTAQPKVHWDKPLTILVPAGKVNYIIYWLGCGTMVVNFKIYTVFSPVMALSTVGPIINEFVYGNKIYMVICIDVC